MRLARPAGALAVTVTFLWLFVRQVDLSAAATEVAGLPAWALAAGLAAVLANLGFAALRWHYLLKAAGFPAGLRGLFATLCSGIGVSNVLPARAGDVLRVEALRSGEGIPALAVVGTLFAERLLDGVVLSAWIMAGAFLLGAGGPLLLTGIALSAGSALGVVLVAAASTRPAVVLRVARALRVERSAASFVTGLGAFRSRRTLAGAVALSAAVWLADLALYVALGAGLGLDTSLGGYLALEGTGNLALAVPATAAGLGSFDYLTLLTARAIAVPEGPATGYVLAVHAFTVVPVTFLGLIFLHRAIPRRGGLVEEPA